MARRADEFNCPHTGAVRDYAQGAVPAAGDGGLSDLTIFQTGTFLALGKLIV